jgi:hypothetical protein
MRPIDRRPDHAPLDSLSPPARDRPRVLHLGLSTRHHAVVPHLDLPARDQPARLHRTDGRRLPGRERVATRFRCRRGPSSERRRRLVPALGLRESELPALPQRRRRRWRFVFGRLVRARYSRLRDRAARQHFGLLAPASATDPVPSGLQAVRPIAVHRRDLVRVVDRRGRRRSRQVLSETEEPHAWQVYEVDGRRAVRDLRDRQAFALPASWTRAQVRSRALPAP